MKIIATTNTGFLIEATETEVNDIIKSTTGALPKIEVGLMLPAHDYAAKVRECKGFKDSSEFKSLKTYAERSSTKINNLISSFEKLGNED